VAGVPNPDRPAGALTGPPSDGSARAPFGAAGVTGKLLAGLPEAIACEDEQPMFTRKASAVRHMQPRRTPEDPHRAAM